jgi:hypothetical protein
MMDTGYILMPFVADDFSYIGPVARKLLCTKYRDLMAYSITTETYHRSKKPARKLILYEPACPACHF